MPAEWIEALQKDYGLAENEAYVFALLVEAHRLYNELPDHRFGDEAFQTGIQAAQQVLAMRVVRRDHPGGWLTRGERLERGMD